MKNFRDSFESVGSLDRAAMYSLAAAASHPAVCAFSFLSEIFSLFHSYSVPQSCGVLKLTLIGG